MYPEGCKIENNLGLFPADYAAENSPLMIQLSELNFSAFSMGEISYNKHPVKQYLDRCPNFAQKRMAIVVKLLERDQAIRKNMSEKIEILEHDLEELNMKINELKVEPAQAQILDEESPEQRHASVADVDNRNIIQYLETKLQEQQEKLEEAKRHKVGQCQARKLKVLFLHKVHEHNVHWSLDELKHMMTSLDSRVTQLRNILNSGDGSPQLTKAQKVVVLLSKYSEKGIEMDRGDVLKSIMDLNQDLLELEHVGVLLVEIACLATAPAMVKAKDTVPTGKTRHRDESGVDKVRASKRDRVNMSP